MSESRDSVRGAWAIRYAHRAAIRQDHFYRTSHDESPMPMSYYVWLIETDACIVLVDTGFTAETAERLGGREYLQSPIEIVRRLGVEPDDVTDVVLSHLHLDHTGNLGVFRNATIHVQTEEMRFWFGPDAGVGEFPGLAEPADLAVLASANLAGRVHWLDGDVELIPGVSLHLVGGHTPGSQVVRISAADRRIVLASDASHFYANFEERRPYAIVHTLPAMYAAFERIVQLGGPGADHVVPGHDPLVLENYPAASPELEGLAVRLI